MITKMMLRLKYAVHVIRTERRLPGRLINAPAALAPTYLAARLRGRFVSASAPQVVIEDAHRMAGRFVYSLADVLSRWKGGVEIERAPSLADYARLTPEGRFMYWHPKMRVVAPRAAGQAPVRAVICRTAAEAAAIVSATRDKPERTLAVCTDLRSPALPDSLGLPFTVHTERLREITPTSLLPLRAKPRTLRVFFSGKLYDIARSNHDHEIIERCFDMPNRSRALRVVRDQMGLEEVHVVNDMTDRKALFGIDGEVRRQVVCSQLKGRTSDWLDELSHADFFLALPGSHMPMCFNVIETLAVGTIPILSYADWFWPPLRDGIECLQYRTDDELVAALRRAIEMPPEEIARMRTAVAAYYDEHVAPEAAARIIESLGPQLRVLYLNTEDTDNYCNAPPDAVLFRGGTLQPGHAVTA